MGNNLNLKKTGLLILLVASCIIGLGSISVLIQYNAMYGSLSGLGEYIAFDIVALAGAYYFCAKDFRVDTVTAYRKASRGPLMGLAYFVLCSTVMQIGIVHIALAVGYILVLIANVQLVKEDRAKRREAREQNL